MSNTKKKSVDATEETKDTSQYAKAYGISQVEGTWHLFEVLYSPETLDTGAATSIANDNSQFEIEEKLKVVVAERLFV